MRDTSSDTSGLLSNVFGYLTREVESFVATATGGPVPSVSRLYRVQVSGVLTRPNGLQRVQSRDSSRSKRTLNDGSRARKLRRVDSSSEREHEAPNERPRKTPSRAPRDTSTLNESHEPSPQTGDVGNPQPGQNILADNASQRADADSTDTGFHPSHARSTLEARPQRHLRGLAVTMPGSLYPRSPSLAPDEGRHIHFSVNVTSPLRRRTPSPLAAHDEHNLSPSTTHNSTDAAADRSSAPADSSLLGDVFTSPRRGVTSVKEAVRQFAQTVDTVDPTIMLPSPTTSPARTRKEKEGDNATLLPLEAPNPKTSAAPPPTASPDGADPDGHSPESSARRWKGKERAYEFSFAVDPDSSDVIRMRGKEKELDDAREEHREKEQKRRISGAAAESDVDPSRDKARIRALEEEIQHLRAELAKRPARHSSIQPGMMPPPPPPPPPMPDPIASTSRSDLSSSTHSLLSVVRASLKHTAAPVEVPINIPGIGAGGRTKRTGQPTVNIAGDKMESFLNEVKSAKLRRVGANPTFPANRQVPPNGVHPLARRATMDVVTGETSRRSWLDAIGNTSIAGGEVAAGKRKRDMASADVYGGLKRRHETFPNVTTSNLSASTSALPSISSSRVVRVPQRVLIQPGDPLRRSTNGPPAASRPSLIIRNHPLPPRLTEPAPTWPSGSTAMTDLTTPSLCSDNEGDQEAETASDEHTPPVHDLVEYVPRARSPRRQRRLLPPETVPEAVPHAPSRSQDFFEKRVPSSRTLLKTPRKPRPPGRRSVSLTHAVEPQERSSDEDSDDEPLLLNFSPYNKIATARINDNSRILRQPSPLPALDLGSSGRPTKDISSTTARTGAPLDGNRASARRSRAKPTLSRERRPDTLSDELSRAFQTGRRGEDIADDDFDSGVLVGVGTRSKKRGFLARGGAGGAPVFMGVGYVDGAEEEGEEEPIHDRVVRHRRSQERRKVQALGKSTSSA